MTSNPPAAALVACGTSHLLRLDEGSAELVDVARGSVTRLEGALAIAARRFAAGESPGAALEALGRDVAGLGEALACTPEPLDPARALARGGFDTLFLELTGACNERCAHCYAGSGPEVTTALDRATCLAVLDEAARLGFRRVQLTGGDPLLCRFLPDLVRAGATLGLEVEIFTNGLALRDSLLDDLAAHRPGFAMSLYSHDAATHDAVTRTPGSHARTLAAVERVRARGLGLRLAMVVMDANAGHVEATRELAARLGVESFGWAPMRAAGRGGFFAGAGAPHDLGHRPAAAERAARGTLCVLASGEVVPCIFNRDDVLGSVRQRSLGDVVRAPDLPRRERRSSGEVLDDCHRSLQCVDCRRTAFALRALAGA